MCVRANVTRRNVLLPVSTLRFGPISEIRCFRLTGIHVPLEPVPLTASILMPIPVHEFHPSLPGLPGITWLSHGSVCWPSLNGEENDHGHRALYESFSQQSHAEINSRPSPLRSLVDRAALFLSFSLPISSGALPLLCFYSSNGRRKLSIYPAGVRLELIMGRVPAGAFVMDLNSKTCRGYRDRQHVGSSTI